MNVPGTRELQQIRRNSWLTTRQDKLHEIITVPNLVGVIGCAVLLFLLLVPPLPWNIRLPLYFMALVWTILRPRVSLYLLAFCVPWGSLDYIDVSSLRLNSADILVIFLALGWLINCALPVYTGLRDRDAAHIPVYLILAMFALLGIMLLSMTVALNKSDSLKEISKWLEVLVILLLGSQYLRTRRQVWTIIVLVCIAGMTQAVYGYAQAFLSLGPQSFIRSDILRVYGTFGQPNPYAAYINLPLSIALAVTLLGRDWLTRVLAGIATITLAVAEFLSQSRGAEIALATAFAFIILAGVPGIRKLFRVLIIALLGFVEALLLGWVPQTLFSPALKFLGLSGISLTEPSNQDFSTAERLAHWIAGLHMYFDHPILGVGIANYPDAYPPYHIANFLDPLGHAHNYYINVAAEMGTIGLIVYLLFLLAIFAAGAHALRALNKKYWQAKALPVQPQPPIQAPLGTGNKLKLLLHPFSLVRHSQRQWPLEIPGMLTNDRALAIGLIAALITVQVHNFVDDVYVHSLTSLIALLLIALIRLERVTPEVYKQAAFGG
ncbi:MAG TPA: O-antigen ligase family protein [Ktedonobacteraceae bacterium]|nr:O-antigen ligase family protein [Ktedonobacteraceae bacterium]